jgi:hypothetical protein
MEFACLLNGPTVEELLDLVARDSLPPAAISRNIVTICSSMAFNRAPLSSIKILDTAAAIRLFPSLNA